MDDVLAVFNQPTQWFLGKRALLGPNVIAEDNRLKEFIRASLKNLTAYSVCKSVGMRGNGVSCANVLGICLGHFRSEHSCGNGNKSFFW